MTHEYFAVENRARVAVENPFVQLVTIAMRLLVIDYRVRIGVLVGADKIQTVHPTLRAFVIQHDRDIVTRQTATEIDRGRIVTAVSSELG